MKLTSSLPTLQTERLVIRFPDLAEAGLVARFYRDNKSHLEPWGPKFPDGIDDEYYWRFRLGQERDAAIADSRFRFFLFDQGDIAGYANLNEIVRGGTQSCTLSYCIAATHEGMGYMVEALRELIRFGFEELNLHRIEACYQPKNVRSAHVLKRLGFEVEATLRKLILIDGVWEDHILASLINDYWRPE